MSLPKQWKQWGNADLRETKQITHKSKGTDESYPDMYFFLNLGHYVKSCGLFVKFSHFLCHIILWSYHMTQEANVENFSFCLNSTFNIRKSPKVSSGKALYFRSYQRKTSRGRPGLENTPSSAFRVKSGVSNSSPVSLPIIVQQLGSELLVHAQ